MATFDPIDERLRCWIASYRRVFALTGAGCSTASGIPDYRDDQGEWNRRPPVMIQAFRTQAAVYRRYWARAYTGWPRFTAAAPGTAHRAFAAWEAAGTLLRLVTQNVDGLHQRAGSRAVVDLHGRLDVVICLRLRGERIAFGDVSGRYHVCGVTTAGAAYCWGGGVLGDGNSVGSATPVPVAGGLTFAAVSAGAYSTWWGHDHWRGVLLGEHARWTRHGQLDRTGSAPLPAAARSPRRSQAGSGSGRWMPRFPFACGVTTGGSAYRRGSKRER